MILTKMKSLAISGATSVLFFSSVGSSNAIGLTNIPVSDFTFLEKGDGGTNVTSGSVLNSSIDTNLTFPTQVDSFGGFFTSDFV